MHGCPPDLTCRRDFEHFLRRHGFSKARSREIAVYGFRDAAEDERDAIKLLRTLVDRLEIDLDVKNVSG